MIFIKKAISVNDYKDFVNFPFKLYKDSKYWVPPISNEELEYIKAKAPANSAAPSIPFLEVIKNRPFIAIVVATFCNNWALFTFLSYLPEDL